MMMMMMMILMILMMMTILMMIMLQSQVIVHTNARHSIQIPCPCCKHTVMTQVSYEPSFITWLTCLGLCIIGCNVGCCLVSPR
jgi:hypothetical protein